MRQEQRDMVEAVTGIVEKLKPAAEAIEKGGLMGLFGMAMKR